MKTRDEIITQSKNAPLDGNEDRVSAILEVLLDIRDLPDRRWSGGGGGY